MNSNVYRRVLNKLTQHRSQFQAAINFPTVVSWKNSTNDNPAQLLAYLSDCYTSNNENVLVLYLQALYELTNDAELVELSVDLFNDVKVGKIEGLQLELNQLQEHLQRGWTDVAYAAKRKVQLENEIYAWNNKQCNRQLIKESVEMIVTSQTVDSFENILLEYARLKTLKSVYDEFNANVPESILKTMRKLKRQIEAQLEMQKDSKRDELKTKLREAETVEERRERLRKELEELGEDD